MNATLIFLACATAATRFDVQPDVGTTYRVDFSDFMRVDILNNKVHTLYHGIDLRFNDGAQHILVQGNDITFGAFDCSSGCPSYSGINVAEGNYPAFSSRILDNTLHFVQGAPSRQGIGLLAADGWVVANNALHMVDNSFNQTGILLDGCNGTDVSCNTITSVFNTWINDRQAAIRNFMGSDPLISCNYMDRTTNGILFNGNVPDTDVRGNSIDRHKWGLRLGFNTVIGEQELKGNLWSFDPLPIGGWAAWCQDDLNASNSLFLVNPSGGNSWPPSVSPATGWFQIWEGPNYDCGDDEGEDYCSQYRVRGAERLTELDERVANDSLENDPYTEETKWMLKGDLYKKLDENPELQDSLQIMAEFYDELQGSTTAAFKAVDDGQQILYDLDSSFVNQLRSDALLMDSLVLLVQAGLEELGDSTLTSLQREAILTTINGYRQSIGDLSTSNADALQMAAEAKAQAAETVRSANAAVATSELIESNQKQVNDIYLGTIAEDVDGFTAAQVTALFDIANQCPMIGGNAVFTARSLYSLVDDSQVYDDPLLCIPYGIEVKRSLAEHTYALSVVPNPATDEASLVYTKETKEPAYLVLYNVLGSEALRVLVPKGVVRHVFSIVGIAPGSYHYKVLSGDGILGDGKLTIVR